ncbi:MAG TPA: anaerobic nitric oxide reductase flavorubredoxin [Clostridia bacterium]|jgi:flavorubredoxin|nr:MAG: Anaerobic nitric oxide reductase flavorubredoxin [Firmicutes bacterium ADurb.Bin146]HOD92299.1 anaerobic nitric oxide reductase flavorubredoxin [Clostridia bacterium]HQM38704.1 anaerobic nitric oxide reductase flavorubredoxin [Clostridia bacterium]
MKKLIKNNVYWVGKTDWELKKFHGDEYSTHNGSSYNSYLILEEKTVLIDTVWAPFDNDFIDNLEKEIDLSKIDYIVSNHGEVDHSGALVKLMEKIPHTPIYCSANAVKSLKGQYFKDWDLRVQKTGDTLDVGNGKKLIFLEMRMLHWPDSMAAYLTKDNILFSNDAFGQHYASDHIFNDLVDQCTLFAEAEKYYANILTPFSAILKKKLEEIVTMNIDIDIIAPSHGIIWRDNPMQIVEKYALWCNDYQENLITIIYDTMWNGTKALAEKIAEGIRSKDADVQIKIFNLPKSDINDIATQVFKSKMVLLGSPTINNCALHSLAALSHYMKGLKFKNKKAAAFGCYGWSGESIKILNEMLTDAGFDVVNEGLKCLWNPSLEVLEKAYNFGKDIV